MIDPCVEHYNTERPYKGLDCRRPVELDKPLPRRDGPVLCRQRLGGPLRSYYQGAACPG